MDDDDDDDAEEYLDPEYDDIAGGGGEPVPGPFSLSQLVTGVHLLAAAAVIPFFLLALLDGNLPQVVTLAALVVMLVIAGVYVGRVARRREP